MDRFLDVLNLLSVLILMSSFILVANKRTDSYIKTFRLQSILLALVAGFFGVIEKGAWGIIIICLLIVGLKVIYMPHMLKKITQRVEYKVEKDFFINIPMSIIICCGIVILSWYVISNISGIQDAYTRMFLTNSISVVLIGLFFMVSRRKAVGQIIGFLTIENGMFLAAILMTYGMPLIVELGIFLDILMAFLIMGIFVFRINETFESIDINKLRNLRG